MNGCAILVDVNLLLHFRPLEEFDWCRLAGCDACSIVVTPVLLRELEKQKIFNKSSVLRGRAARAIDALLVRLRSEPPVRLRSGVIMEFVDAEPDVDFPAERLSREVDDDHYIASALALAASTGRRTFIASNDGGMALKLHSRPIGHIAPPPELALPVEADPEQRELRELRAEVARLKSRSPRPTLAFSDGGQLLVVSRPSRFVSSTPGIDVIRAEHAKVRIHQRQGPAPGSLGSEASNHGSALAGLVAGLASAGRQSSDVAYNARLDDYYSDYKRFLEEEATWLDLMRRSHVVRLVLANEGGAGATDVEVTVICPAAARFCKPQDLPTRPCAPSPPERRVPASSGFANAYSEPYAFSAIDYGLHDGAVTVAEDGRTARFRVRSLRPEDQATLDEIVLTSAVGSVAGLQLAASISFTEDRPVSCSLAIRYDETEPLTTSLIEASEGD